MKSTQAVCLGLTALKMRVRTSIMDQRLIKLRTVICQSPDLPAIHLSKSLITNDTCGLRSTISLKCSCAVIFFLSFFLRGVVENNTDAVVQVKADRCLKGGDVCPTLSEQISLKKSSLFYFYFSLERLLFSRASVTSPLSLAPCFSIDQPAISSLLPPFGLSHPYASYYLQLLFLYEKLNVHSSGPWVVFLFFPCPFHPSSSL